MTTSRHRARRRRSTCCARLGLTTIFSNPGSTEVPFLAGLPDDLTLRARRCTRARSWRWRPGYAIGRGAPALALLHSTPGLGNAVAALATARVNRAPLVVLVGQQDRRHLALEPFLAGRLHGLAGDYPVWVDQPARAQDVPGAIVRAYHEAATARGPAIVIVPMDDWAAPAPEPHEVLGPSGCCARAAADPAAVDELAALLDEAGAPRDRGRRRATRSWAALVALAERLACPVFQEPFGGQAGFPQDHPRFAGHLPARRARLREVLAPHDVVLVVGAGAFRQYPFDAGAAGAPGTRVAVVSARPRRGAPQPGRPRRARRARRDLRRAGGGGRRAPRPAAPGRARPAPPPPPPGPASRCAPATCSPRSPSGSRATRSCVEETPSSRPELHARIPTHRAARLHQRAWGCSASRCRPRSALRMARPDRPVLAVVGDGSSLYQIQALWSAAALRRRRALRRAAPTAATRSWTGSPSAPARHGPWPRSTPSTSPRWRARQGCDARAHRPPDDLERLDALAARARRPRRRRCCSRSSSRRTRPSIL